MAAAVEAAVAEAAVAVVATAAETAVVAVTAAAETAGSRLTISVSVRSGTIKTKDLDLVPYTPADLIALIKGAAEFCSSFGIPAADGLREFLLGPEVSPGYVDMLRSSPEPDIWRHGFGLVHQSEGLVVGNTAFVGPPNDAGEVEIAYGVVPAFEGRGFATQAAEALTQFAFADERVRTVIAHTLPESNASTHILQKIGFAFAGDIEHPEDGTIWRWERQKETSEK
jgi:ribosomal-protein-alanine N-acetyltransferase